MDITKGKKAAAVLLVELNSIFGSFAGFTLGENPHICFRKDANYTGSSYQFFVRFLYQSINQLGRYNGSKT
jgi:hypothetical protein